MKKTILAIATVLLVFTACHRGNETPSREEMAKVIDSIEATTRTAVRMEAIDTAKGNRLMSLYIHYADAYPEDSISPIYLQKAAQIATGMFLIDDMVTLYDRIIDNYPNYSQLVECYYEKGIALDNAGRKDEARIAYQEFLEEYPDHFLANDIRKALPLLDMSDELLIDYLSKINEQESGTR